MQLALKFEEDPVDLSAGIETVVFRKQMLVDVFFHEREPMPTLQDFLTEPLERMTEDNEGWWVYRQGTYIPSYVFRTGELYVGHALTDDLNKSEVTTEGYHHVPVLFLNSGGLISNTDKRYTAREQNENLTRLYMDIAMHFKYRFHNH